MSGEMRWLSVHVHHRASLDDLLIEAVHPVTRDLAASGLTGGCFFLRYGDGGQHLRLRLRCSDSDRETVRQHLVQGLEGFVDSTDALRFVPYIPEYDRYGSGELLDTVEDHFVASSTLVLQRLVAGLTTPQRDTMAFALILLTWRCSAPDPGRVLRSLSDSHTGSRLSNDDRAHFDDLYHEQKQVLKRITAAIWPLADGAAPSGDHGLGQWTQSMTTLRSAYREEPLGRTWKVLDTCAHLACNRLGLSRRDEGYVRRLAVRSIMDFVP